MYEGKVTFEDWLGGNVANDYVLDGQYMRDIFEELLDKKIKITVIDDYGGMIKGDEVQSWR